MTVVAIGYTVRSARDVVLHRRPLAVRGPRSNPRAIVLPWGLAGELRHGTILAQAPSAALPAGLFDRVTAIHNEHGRAVVGVAPASLWEAFPSLNVDTTVTFAAGAHAAGLGDFDLGFAKDLIPHALGASCGAPPTGWSLSPFGSLRPELTAHIHRGFLGLPYGELSLSLAGTAGFDAGIPSAAHCDLTIAGPHPTAVIPIAGVPVPVEGKLDLGISLALDGPTHVHASASATLTGGASLHGASATPILTLRSGGSGSIHSAGGVLTVGPQMEVGLGLGDVNAHIDDAVDVSGQDRSGGCEIDLGGSAGVGVDLGPLHASFTPVHPDVPIYHCPSVSLTSPGDQTSTIGVPVSLAIHATDSDGQPLSYSSSGLPAGLVLDPSTGAISGTPSAPVTSAVTVTATDASGPSASTTFQWTVGASEAAGGVVTFPGSPLVVSVGARGQCQSGFAGAVNNYYPPDEALGDCGFFLALPAHEGQPESLSGSTWGFDGSAGPTGLAEYQPVSQSVVTGSGTASDPYREATVFAVELEGTPDLLVTETTTYLNGASSFTSTYDVKNTSGATIWLRAIYAGDLYTAGSDCGSGVLEPGPPRVVGAIGATSATPGCETVSEPGRLGGLEEAPPPAPPWSSFEEGCWNDASTELISDELEQGRCAGAADPGDEGIWHDVESTVDEPQAFDGAVDPSVIDNGVGVEWDQRLAAGLPSGGEEAFTIVNRG